MMLFKFKYFVSGLIFLLLFKTGFSQTYSGGIGIGYGMYQMNDMKNFQEKLINSVDITNLSSVVSFPGFIFYSAHLYYLPKNKINSFGTEFNYYMTGARNHAADYSGEYKTDIQLNGYRLGLNYKMYVEKTGPLTIYAQLGAGAFFNKMTLNEDLTIFDQEILSDTYFFNGISTFIEPKIILSIPVYKQLNLNLNIAYEYDFKNKLKLRDDRSQILYLGYNPASVKWTGLRFMTELSYNLNN